MRMRIPILFLSQVLICGIDKELGLRNRVRQKPEVVLHEADVSVILDALHVIYFSDIGVNLRQDVRMFQFVLEPILQLGEALLLASQPAARR